MKLLRIEASHYRNCADNICIDFVPISRKTEEDKSYELNEIDDSLYTFRTTAVIGKNASGKTSVLKLINNVYSILSTFQLEDEILSINGTQLSIYFHHEEKIYNYQVELKREVNLGKNLSFINEKIYESIYYKSNNNKLFNLDMIEKILKKELPDDISNLFYILKKRQNYAYYYDDNNNNDNIYHDIYNLYKSNIINKSYWKKIIQLFDDNIIDLEEIRDEIYIINYLGESSILSASELFNMLSSGTTKGIALYTSAIQSLLTGCTFIIDEIENHFHKTLVENLISLFKDSSVNKKNANLIFSTHYCELLDLFGRNDNIWITKSKNKIILTNMYNDYNVRNDLLKSKKFYEDNFGTTVDYELLMNLKRELINE